MQTKGATMKSTLTSVVATLVAVAALCGAAATSANAAQRCSSGPTTYQGVRAYTGCGPATAVVKLGGRTLRYRGGSCRRTVGAFELDMGTTILGETSKPLPRFFGVAIGRIFGVGRAAPRDGVYTGGMVVFVDGGKRYASLAAKVVLAGARTRGSFTARVLGGPPVSGSFTCS
jgi:hypothetical protein